MNKEEILQKARLEKDDELVTHINNLAMFIITLALTGLGAVGMAMGI